MFFRLILLFTIVPFVELMLLVWLSRVTTIWVTILIVLTTGIVGATLARIQGWQVITRIRSEMQQGSMPAAVMFDGVLIFAAGLLLVTPGLLTDAVGFSLLVPAVRSTIRHHLIRWVKESSRVQVASFGFDPPNSAPRPDHPEIIDAEFSRLPSDRTEKER